MKGLDGMYPFMEQYSGRPARSNPPVNLSGIKSVQRPIPFTSYKGVHSCILKTALSKGEYANPYSFYDYFGPFPRSFQTLQISLTPKQISSQKLRRILRGKRTAMVTPRKMRNTYKDSHNPSLPRYGAVIHQQTTKPATDTSMVILISRDQVEPI